ncbi:MAG: hypothetical protein ABH883_07965 [Candidatus Omnitrophota bacterium]
MLYDSGHPLCTFSSGNFISALEKWLINHENINLGFSEDKVFLDGVCVEDKKGRYVEAASFLHKRGIVSVSVKRGMFKEEIFAFFKAIRVNERELNEKGGILKSLPPLRYLKVKEIDYRDILVSAKEEVATEETKIWKKLFDIAQESAKGKLPESKVEFLVNFLKDTKRSAVTLNRVYHQAVEKLRGPDAVQDIQGMISKVCAYFERETGDMDIKEVRVDLMRILSQLDTDLVAGLFERATIDGHDFELAEAVTRDFSDSFIADFIESLISGEDTFNENLLKVFDKLAPGAGKADSIVGMVADKLFSKRILNADTLSKLQMSVKEIFASHPESNFMSQMYKITVDAVTNKKIDTLIYVARLSPLISRFVQSVEEEKLKKEEVWLLLNLLWLEESSVDFGKFSGKLVAIMPELFDSRDTARLREIMEFFSEKLRPEQKKDRQMAAEIKTVLKSVASKENIDSIIDLIPDASSKEMDDISEILLKSGVKSGGVLIDAFIRDKNPAHRNKYRLVLSRMREEVTEEIIDRLDYSEPHIVRDLLNLIKEYAPEKAHLVAMKMINHSDPQMRWEGLEGFVPGTHEEIESVFRIYRKEKNPEIQKKAAAVLLRARKTEVIDRLFFMARRSFFGRRARILQLVELCGQLKIAESVAHLKVNFLKRGLFFNTASRDEFRGAVVTSLGRIHTEEAMELVVMGTKDTSKKVKKMCQILLELDKNGETKEHMV